MVKEKWLLGMFEVTNKVGVIVYIKKRDAKAINTIIKEHTKSEAKIWADCWRWYQKLDNFNSLSPTRLFSTLMHTYAQIKKDAGQN